MRELTLEELELVAGGLDTGDIVVTGDGGGGGDWGDWGDWGGGDFGDYGGGGGGDAGGGGDGGDTSLPPIQATDNHGNSVTIEPKVDVNAKTADIIVTAANTAGDFKVDFDLAKMDVKSVTLDIHDGNATYTGTADLSSGMVTGIYAVDFGNGTTGTFSIGTDGSNYSVNASVSLHF
jgi:hypothetical protein